MGHKLKFKVGDKVRIVANRFTHSGEIGEVHKITYATAESRKGPAAREYQEYKLDGLLYPWVTETDIELAFPRSRSEIEAEIAELQAELSKIPVVDEHWEVTNTLGKIGVIVDEDTIDVTINGYFVVKIDKDGVYRSRYADSDSPVPFDAEGRIIDHS